MNQKMIEGFLASEKKINSKIPAGYVEIKLSSKGKVYAPEVFHIRNFKIGEILKLSTVSEADLPSHLINTLNNMIFEDCDVGNWNDKEVEETMMYLYIIFYKKTLEMTYPFSERELLDIKKLDAEIYKDIIDKRYTPKTEINLIRDVDTYKVDKNFKRDITLVHPTTHFKVTFSPTRYRDKLVVKDFLKKYPEYTLDDILPIINISNFNGRDLSELSLSERFFWLKDQAQIDFPLIQKYLQERNKNKFGIKLEVSITNPLTKEVEVKPLSFRISFILQSIYLSGANIYTIFDNA